MKHWKRLAAALLAMAMVLALAACGGGESKPEALVDLNGTEITLPEKVERIVSLSPSTTEILAELGALDRVVGVDAYSNYPEGANAIEKVGDYNGINVELILAAKPDVVLYAGKLQDDVAGQLKEMNIPMIACEATEYGQIEESITLIGAIVGKEDEAKALNESIKEAETAETPEDPETVYYVMSFGDYGNWTSGPGSFINEMIKFAGGYPITEDANPSAPWMDYSLEALVAADPDVLLFAKSLGDPAALKSASGYQELTAVKEGKVYVVDDDIVSRPGPRVKDGIEMIREILYGEKFCTE